MTQTTCSICNKPFNTEQELQEHQRTAHPGTRKEGDRPSDPQHHREDKIAS